VHQPCDRRDGMSRKYERATSGCKVSRYESQQLPDVLHAYAWRPAAPEATPGLAIITDTRAVTDQGRHNWQANRRSHHSLRQFSRDRRRLRCVSRGRPARQPARRDGSLGARGEAAHQSSSLRVAWQPKVKRPARGRGASRAFQCSSRKLSAGRSAVEGRCLRGRQTFQRAASGVKRMPHPTQMLSRPPSQSSPMGLSPTQSPNQRSYAGVRQQPRHGPRARRADSTIPTPRPRWGPGRSAQTSRPTPIASLPVISK
jgi:hypothetical protein